MFISGPGDTHFVLPLLRMHAALGAWVEEGTARLSVASTEFVAMVAVSEVRRLLDGAAPETIHVVPDRPITVRELISETLTRWGAGPSGSVTAEEAVELLAPAGVPERKVRQFARDYFISSTHIRSLIPDTAGPEYSISAVALSWYAEQRPGVLPSAASTGSR